jgi:hypothetical protein
MLGIDIIDHSFSFRSSKYSLDQYKRKILNNAELFFCETWNDLDILWAIKESAYKNHFKKTGSYFINPKRIFIVDLNFTTGKFAVEIDENYYSGTFKDNPEYVYAVCGEDEPVQLYLFSKIETPELPPYLNNSVIEYHSEGFPQFIVQGGFKYAYSRSHHGNYYISAMSTFSDN